MGKQVVKNQKIAIAAPLYPPEIGGPATYVQMLEEELRARGYELNVVPFSKVRHLPKGVRHVLYVYKLLRSSYGCRLVYALDPVSVGVPAYIVSRLTRKPLWIRLGGDYAWEQGQQRFGTTETLDEYTSNKKAASWPVRFLAALQGFVTRGAARVVIPSEYMKRIVATWGVDPQRLSVVYSALQPLSVKLEKNDYRKRFGFSGKVILSSGRLVPWKGFEVLIEVVEKLRAQYPDVLLLIAGDGPQKGTLHEKIAEAGLSQNVRLLGRLPKEQLGEYIVAADLFVLNTAYEGLSHQLLEVMDLGTPVVTTAVGGNVELIEDGRSGFLVDYNNAEALEERILELLENDSLAAESASEAKGRLVDFSREATVAKLISLLEGWFVYEGSGY